MIFLVCSQLVLLPEAAPKGSTQHFSVAYHCSYRKCDFKRSQMREEYIWQMDSINGRHFRLIGGGGGGGGGGGAGHGKYFILHTLDAMKHSHGNFGYIHHTLVTALKSRGWVKKVP